MKIYTAFFSWGNTGKEVYLKEDIEKRDKKIIDALVEIKQHSKEEMTIDIANAVLILMGERK